MASVWSISAGIASSVCHPPPAQPFIPFPVCPPHASLPGLGRALTQQEPFQSLFYILCASLPSTQAFGPVPVQT